MKHCTLLEDFIPSLHNLREKGLHNENLSWLENVILRPSTDDSHCFSEAPIQFLLGQHLNYGSSPILRPRGHTFIKVQRGTLL
jgi:hypothetical protein